MNDLEQAKHDIPEGMKCSFCGRDNDFADDCGWFFIHPDVVIKSQSPFEYNVGEGGYTCKACWEGEPGKKHIAFFGLGER